MAFVAFIGQQPHVTPNGYQIPQGPYTWFQLSPTLVVEGILAEDDRDRIATWASQYITPFIAKASDGNDNASIVQRCRGGSSIKVDLETFFTTPTDGKDGDNAVAIVVSTCRGNNEYGWISDFSTVNKQFWWTGQLLSKELFPFLNSSETSNKFVIIAAQSHGGYFAAELATALSFAVGNSHPVDAPIRGKQIAVIGLSFGDTHHCIKRNSKIGLRCYHKQLLAFLQSVNSSSLAGCLNPDPSDDIVDGDEGDWEDVKN